MKKTKGNVKKGLTVSVAKEPVIKYKQKKMARKLSKQQVVVPKNKNTVGMSEVVDDELVSQMKRNLKSGYTTHEKVMATLNKIINQK